MFSHYHKRIVPESRDVFINGSSPRHGGVGAHDTTTVNKRLASLCLSLMAVACVFSMAAHAQGTRANVGQPGTLLSEEQIKQSVALLRAGPVLTPKSWPKGARVAVCLSWDLDNESYDIAFGKVEPIGLSAGEYGAKEGLPRILKLLDRHKIPASFYIPAAMAIVYPEMIEELKKRPQHEIGVHGWIHESLPALKDRTEEERLMRKTLSLWTKVLGRRPVGFRAPFWSFSEHTLDMLRSSGFKYDSSAMAMDQPYELLSNGVPTGIVELPVNWILDDIPYLSVQQGTMPSPELVLKVYQDEFDVAYEEGTVFILTMHPMISGRRSRLIYIEKLIEYMKARPGVWFATAEQIADYVLDQNTMLNSSNR